MLTADTSSLQCSDKEAAPFTFLSKKLQLVSRSPKTWAYPLNNPNTSAFTKTTSQPTWLLPRPTSVTTLFLTTATTTQQTRPPPLRTQPLHFPAQLLPQTQPPPPQTHLYLHHNTASLTPRPRIRQTITRLPQLIFYH